MTQTHPATGRPLLDQSEDEQALRVLAGVEPRPTCGTCHASLKRNVYARRGGITITHLRTCWGRFDGNIATYRPPLVDPDDPACDLWEPRR